MLRTLFSLLPPRRTYQFALLIFFIIFKALIEIATLAVIVLFINVLSDPQSVLQNSAVIFVDDLLSLQLGGREHSALIIGTSILLVVSIVLKNTLALLETYIKSRFIHALGGEFICRLLASILHSNYEWILSKRRSNLLEHLSWREQYIVYINSLILSISDILLGITLVLVLVLIYPLQGLISILILGGFGGLIFYFTKVKIGTMAKKAVALRLGFSAIAHNSLHGIKDVHISKSESYFLDHFQKGSNAYNRMRVVIDFFSQSPVALLETLGFSLLALGVIAMLSFASLSLDEILGIVYLFAVVAWRILPLISRVLSYAAAIKGSAPVLRSTVTMLQELQHHQQGTEEEVGKARIARITELSLENISYTYQNRSDAVLQDMCFSIRQGEKIGIIGYSGAGKSTLIDLMVGLLPPEKGRLCINGIETALVSHADWMKQVGYVAQSPFFFEGTIAENIVFRQDSTLLDYKKLEQVSKQASMTFLEDLEDGIDTRLGDRGVKLSGGQVQRVAIARALYREPSLLIFDEATNALDSKTEQAIMDTIHNIGENIMVVIVAHRLQTVERCDRVLWLEEGKIKEIGPPGDILPQFVAVHGGGDIADKRKDTI